MQLAEGVLNRGARGLNGSEVAVPDLHPMAGAREHHRPRSADQPGADNRDGKRGREVFPPWLPRDYGSPNAMMFDPAATATYCLLSNM